MSTTTEAAPVAELSYEEMVAAQKQLREQIGDEGLTPREREMVQRDDESDEDFANRARYLTRMDAAESRRRAFFPHMTVGSVYSLYESGWRQVERRMRALVVVHAPHRAASSSGRPRAHAATGSSSSSTDPPQSEGDKPERHASPQAGARVVEGGTGGGAG